jgi:hypothetical protein
LLERKLEIEGGGRTWPELKKTEGEYKEKVAD